MANKQTTVVDLTDDRCTAQPVKSGEIVCAHIDPDREVLEVAKEVSVRRPQVARLILPERVCCSEFGVAEPYGDPRALRKSRLRSERIIHFSIVA